MVFKSDIAAMNHLVYGEDESDNGGGADMTDANSVPYSSLAIGDPKARFAVTGVSKKGSGLLGFFCTKKAANKVAKYYGLKPKKAVIFWNVQFINGEMQ